MVEKRRIGNIMRKFIETKGKSKKKKMIKKLLSLER
jgi:hypothetical protein